MDKQVVQNLAIIWKNERYYLLLLPIKQQNKQFSKVSRKYRV